MRKPAHASQNAPVLEATVFEKGKRHALFTKSGIDPEQIAKSVALDKQLPVDERRKVRAKVRSALTSLRDELIPGMVNAQLEIGGRRIRVKVAA